MPNDDVAVLSFTNEREPQKPSRRISFSAKAKFSAVYLGYFTDIAVDWSHIVAFHIGPYDKDPSLVRVAVEFQADTRIKPSPFEFGFAQKTCMDQIEQRYGQLLKFEHSQ
ncbi:MAG: hypothetical protein GC190_10845 [Alphaproteobacteria bacterium]|nr:hypothetical protein [Alphaproteobacteria bacterium]